MSGVWSWPSISAMDSAASSSGNCVMKDLVTAEDRAELKPLLAFDLDTAGGVMDAGVLLGLAQIVLL
jgi:hypothetical protein